MAKKTVTECDRCGKVIDANTRSIAIPTGTETDEHSCRQEVTNASIDLCHSCLRIAFTETAVNVMTPETGAAFVASLKSARKRGKE